jgi:uncharacterized damage-inducible protein DinB
MVFDSPNSMSMVSLFQDIFEYHHHFNQQLIRQIEQHEPGLPDKTIPLFCHLLNAHQIWNARILERPAFEVHQRHALDELPEIDQQNYQNTLLILDQYPLEATLNYHNTKGHELSNTIRDILFHIANHSTHHRAQIIAQFRQSGIVPLVTDYIFYKR